MKKHVKIAVKSLLSKPSRWRYRRLLSIGVSALLSIATFLTVIPQTEKTVYADSGSKAIVLVNNGVATNIANPDNSKSVDERWSSVYFGNYKQSSDGSGGYNVDPIKWRVLQNANGKLFLLSDHNLDCMKYKDQNSHETWEDCILRSWLNGGNDHSNDNFINKAFASGEQSAVAETTVENANNPLTGTSGGNITNDKVFLLSIAEASDNNYGFLDNDNSRKSANTAYAYYRDNEGQGAWWLRSPGGGNTKVSNVDDNGIVFLGGTDGNTTGIAVRPAFNLDLSSVIFTSAAVGGKDPATAGTLEAPGDYTGTEWKLTLHDSKMITGIGTAGISRSGSTITVPYTVTGDNAGTANRISVLITDKAYTASDAVIKYYGKLAITGNIGDSGTGTFTLPTDYNTSWKVYILSEQINDDKKSDYAGTPVEIIIPDINVPVSSVTISPKETELKPGASKTLTHTIAPDNATNKNVTWSTSKESVATVDDGKVTAVDEGEAIITVTTEDGDFTDTCRVIVRKDSPVIEECTVTYDPNGGKGDMAPQKADKGETVQLKANAFSRNGYTFTKWNTEPDGSGKDYDDKASVKLEKDMTLYAQWTEDKPAPIPPVEEEYTVTVTVSPAGSGTAKASVKSGKTGTEVTLKAVSKAGYKFKKWKVVSGGVTLADATKTKTTFTIKEANVKVKAVFEKIYEAPQPEIEPVGDDGILLAWWKVDEAEGYDIFMSRCNHGGKEISPKLVKTIDDNKTFKWTATGLKPNKSYKALIKAYVTDKNGKKKYISKSPLMHVYTAGGNRTYTNAKSIKLNTSDGKIKKGNKLTLQVKDTYKIKASVKKADKKKKLLPDSHVKTLRYRSSDPGVATVSSKGKITAKKKGKCNIYVYAHNGVNKTIKVTVK